MQYWFALIKWTHHPHNLLKIVSLHRNFMVKIALTLNQLLLETIIWKVVAIWGHTWMKHIHVDLFPYIIEKTRLDQSQNILKCEMRPLTWMVKDWRAHGCCFCSSCPFKLSITVQRPQEWWTCAAESKPVRLHSKSSWNLPDHCCHI